MSSAFAKVALESPSLSLSATIFLFIHFLFLSSNIITRQTKNRRREEPKIEEEKEEKKRTPNQGVVGKKRMI